MKANIEIFLAVNPTFTADKDAERRFIFDFDAECKDAYHAAEIAFEFTNAPTEFLSDERAELARAYRATTDKLVKPRSVSVGDSVVVNFKGSEPIQLLCAPSGWELI